ncbi:hypothetical protein [Gimesia chilikensis]|uniref:Prepilin-type N-terminal cleavage/methylation domain-containing protein n=1 Tax=Gimesia chilikensis TaxID=2605989 RepID=A0A517PWS7_9PLAN|nr:hypothetical protein [Gimesia chilikensis]QDT23836.1 hypothetical protein HG66A1_56610 [Gimesia chilikensis]
MKKLRFNTGKLYMKTSSKPGRQGVTLMEVLMSVMIMSIGVVSLASLFPISILRGVQATQLTNSTVLRYNAEALIDSLPQRLLFDPDGTLEANGHVRHQRANRKYVVDPWGAYYANLDGTGLEDNFGNDGSNNPAMFVRRFDAGLTTQLPLINYFSLSDSWTLLFEGVPTGINTALDTISIDANDILSGANPSGILSLTELQTLLNSTVGNGRLIIYDTTGKQMQVRAVSGSSINATTGEVSLGTPLPDNGLYNGISKIRFEILEQRYTYLLTVRRSIATDIAAVDVVVFFRRNFTPEYEAIHQTENFVAEWLPGDDMGWGFAGVDDDGDKDDGGATDEKEGEAGWPGSDDYRRRRFRLRYNTSVEKPLLKKGGYVFDVINAHWYRIQKIENETAVTAEITLDQPILQSINPTADGTPTAGLIIMPNVVQVYPLGNKTR